MSFVLPGNARSLRFTGEAKALDLPAPPTTGRGPSSVALGKPRVRKPTAPPPPLQTPYPPPPTMRPPPLHGRGINTPTPSPYGDPSPYLGGINPPVIRHHELESSGENATFAMDRDALDVLPGGALGGRNNIRTPHPGFTPPGQAPYAVPNFRSAQAIAQEQQQHQPFQQQQQTDAQPGRAPWAVWLVASLVMGVVMYFAAPAMLVSAAPRPQPQANAAAPPPPSAAP